MVKFLTVEKQAIKPKDVQVAAEDPTPQPTVTPPKPTNVNPAPNIGFDGYNITLVPKEWNQCQEGDDV